MYKNLPYKKNYIKYYSRKNVLILMLGEIKISSPKKFQDKRTHKKIVFPMTILGNTMKNTNEITVLKAKWSMMMMEVACKTTCNGK